MAHALTYLHDLDIVHRDIKPENIVISNVENCLFRESESSVTLGGLLFALTGGRHTAEHLTTLLLRFLRERTMMAVLIFGASESSHTN